MKIRTLFVQLVAIALIAASISSVPTFGQTTTNIVVTPAYPGVANITGIAQDSAPGFSFGSFKSNGTTKTEVYFTPVQLFNRDFTVGEIESMSYWTKTGVVHSTDPRDWYLVLYTKPYVGDVSTSWYGERIGTEPYFSANVTDPVNTWNQWTTDGPDNQLRFFESTQGALGANFGTYTDPFWSSFVAGNALSGQPYATREVLSLSTQTASGWISGFVGQLDGVRIELSDGSVANINFEPFIVATSRDACKKEGWAALKRANGTNFNNQGECVSYVNTGN